MADLNRRFRLAAIALPFLLLTMLGLARANTIVVDTTSGGTVASHCTLEDAVRAANTQAFVQGCNKGSGTDTILFGVTGTIGTFATVVVNATTSLTITGPPIGGITISGGGGHQIIDHEGGALNLSLLTFANGLAGTGGALLENSTGDLDIHNCLFVNNTAQGVTNPVGGGIDITGTGAVNIVNSTFANNTATHTVGGSFGGAINDVSSSNLKLSNCTFSGNSADNGGAYSSNFKPSVKSTIFEDSTGGNCFATTPTDVNFNISDDGTCSFSAGSSMNNTEALLDPFGLQNNGGPTKTIALQNTSPAIDLVAFGQCSDQSGNPLQTDQRNYVRPDPEDSTHVCDSGAYEFGALAPIVLNSHKVQIARSNVAASDKVNLALNFTYNPDGDNTDCGDDNALADGLIVQLFGSTCASISNPGLSLFLSPFVVHTIGSSSYGTLFQAGPPSVSAKIVTQPTPATACGQWNLTVAVSKASTSGLGNGPFALILSDGTDNTTCFDITDAQVGNQIPGH